MALGIVGLFVLGVILGPFAIERGLDAKKAAKERPEQQLKDEAKSEAKSGLILGIVNIVVWLTVVILAAAVGAWPCREGCDDRDCC